MVSFSQLSVVKKTPFLVQLKQIFGPFYFVMILVQIGIKHKMIRIRFFSCSVSTSFEIRKLPYWNNFPIFLHARMINLDKTWQSSHRFFIISWKSFHLIWMEMCAGKPLTNTFTFLSKLYIPSTLNNVHLLWHTHWLCVQ